MTTALALVIFRLLDASLFHLTKGVVPWLATSLIAITALVVCTDAVRVLGRPRFDSGTLPWVVGWLVGTAVTVHCFSVGRIPLPRWQDVVAFSCTGPLAEELLVRGLVLTAALRAWPSSRVYPGTAVFFSAATFALKPFSITRSGSSLALHILNNALVELL